eukprot:TRINITY_DN925_c0_g2_i1.p1 TRINITY_DN925_c0_g2~~TRINITY_DN925_c0_g2_i1.p1  ORF type:complete len:116 (-),score=12.13 TRINITY_DN925_c0_g2_i1:531-878(-)
MVDHDNSSAACKAAGMVPVGCSSQKWKHVIECINPYDVLSNTKYRLLRINNLYNEYGSLKRTVEVRMASDLVASNSEGKSVINANGCVAGQLPAKYQLDARAQFQQPGSGSLSFH